TGADFKLTLTIVRNNCTITCEKTVPVGTSKIEIVAIDPNRALTCGDTATFCAVVTPPDGLVSYSWTITGGSILTSPSASCVKIRAGTGTEVKLHVLISRNNCTVECERIIPISPPPPSGCPPCVITGPTSILAGGTAKLCGPEGPFTYRWSTGDV